VKGGSQSVLPKQNQDSAAADSTYQDFNSLSRWSSNAESMSLSDALETSEDKSTSKQCGRYIIFVNLHFFVQQQQYTALVVRISVESELASTTFFVVRNCFLKL